MSRLTTQDIKIFNNSILELYSTRTQEEYPSCLHKVLRMNISGNMAVVDLVNTRNSTSLMCKMYPDDRSSTELSAFANSIAPSQSPAWLKCADQPRAISDFIDYSQWSRRDLHWVYQQSGNLDSLGLDIGLTDTLTLRLRDLRDRFGQYEESERLKLKLLGPHIKQVFHRLLAQGQFGGKNWRTRATQVQVGIDGKSCIWTSEARDLLSWHGVLVLRDELPMPISDWFFRQKQLLEHPKKLAANVEPLGFRRENKRLSLFLLRKGGTNPSYWIVFEEKEHASGRELLFPELGVSVREAEVLYWLSYGKSNAEIAAILGVSSGTVGRHLENVFPKLGVESRLAAGLMVTQALATQNRGASPWSIVPEEV